MLETPATAGDSGMLLIGADGSIKLHGGSTIFSGDNKTQHSLLAQKNSDGTMSVYMVPNDGPNKGKMFMVMPSSNGASDGQGWKMARNEEGKTILTPTYMESPTVYVPPSVIPPQFEQKDNGILTTTANYVPLSSLTTNATDPANSQQKVIDSTGNVFSFVVPSAQSDDASGLISILPRSIPEADKLNLDKPNVNGVSVIDSRQQPTNTASAPITTQSKTTSAADFQSTIASAEVQSRVALIAAQPSNAETSDNTARPMLLFTHEAAANLAKTQRNNNSEISTTGGSANDISGKPITPLTSMAGRIIYPVVNPNSVNPATTGTKQTVIVYPGTGKETVLYPSTVNTNKAGTPVTSGIHTVILRANPVTSTNLTSAVKTPSVVSTSVGSTLKNSCSDSIKNETLAYVMVNKSANPKLAQVVACTKASTASSPISKVYLTSAGKTNGGGSYISLLPVNTKSSENVKSVMSALKTDTQAQQVQNVPVAIAAQPNKSPYQPYIISLRVSTPSVSATQITQSPTNDGKSASNIPEIKSFRMPLRNSSSLVLASNRVAKKTVAMSTSVCTLTTANPSLPTASPRLSAPFLETSPSIPTGKIQAMSVSDLISNEVAKSYKIAVTKAFSGSSSTVTVSSTSSRSLPKFVAPNILSTSASGALRTVVNRVINDKTRLNASKLQSAAITKETVSATHVDSNKTNTYSVGQKDLDIESSSVNDDPSEAQNDEIPFRIDSVFSLSSQDEGEDTDSAEETTDVVQNKTADLTKNKKNKALVKNKTAATTKNKTANAKKNKISEKFSSDVIEVSNDNDDDENILEAMTNFKLARGALSDVLLNRPTFVVLDKLPSKYKTENYKNPCNRKCRERFIRMREKKKINELESKINALKSRIRDKKWKSESFEEPKDVNRSAEKNTNKDSVKPLLESSFEDLEMPKLEAAGAGSPKFSASNEREMPDLLVSPSEKSRDSSEIDIRNLHADTISTKLSPSLEGKQSTLQNFQNIQRPKESNSQCNTGLVRGVLSTVKTQSPPITVSSANSVSVTSSTTVPGSGTVSSSGPVTGQLPHTKFYLIKVDDKSILIPAINTGVQPRAYILDPKSQSSNKLVNNLQPATTGLPNLRLVVPASSSATNTWSNPSSIDPNRACVTKASGNTVNTNVSSSSQLHMPKTFATNQTRQAESVNVNLKSFSDVNVKKEPVTTGYGDEGDMGTIKVKAEKYRGYSDEVPPADLNKDSEKETTGSNKRGNNESYTESGDGDISANKIQKLDAAKIAADKSKEDEEKAKRIKNLKDMLRKQETALEEIRRKRLSEVPSSFEID